MASTVENVNRCEFLLAPRKSQAPGWVRSVVCSRVPLLIFPNKHPKSSRKIGHLPRFIFQYRRRRRSWAWTRRYSSFWFHSFDLFGFSTNKTLKLYVAGYDGIVHIYEVDTTGGGECKQIREHPLFGTPQPPANQPAQRGSQSEVRNAAGKFFDLGDRLDRHCARQIRWASIIGVSTEYIENARHGPSIFISIN